MGLFNNTPPKQPPVAPIPPATGAINPASLLAGIGGVKPQNTVPVAENVTPPARPSGLTAASLIGGGNTERVQEQMMGTTRFLNVKYRIYIVGVAFLLFFIYPTVLDAYTSFSASQQAIQDIDLKITRTIEKQRRFASDYTLLKGITKQEADILSCITFKSACETLPVNIKEMLPVLQTYFQLNSLETEKMEIDEKKILKNINEFLLQKDPFGTQMEYNGQILKISIGKPEKKEGFLYTVPLSLSATFATKEQVLSFLHHIENEVFYKKDSAGGVLYDTSILYKITSITYDIMNYDVAQDVAIEATIYYYSKSAPLF